MTDQQQPEENMKTYKITLLGASGVGKTSILNRYAKDFFENNILSTSGVGFFTKIYTDEQTKETCKLDVK